MHHRRGRPKYQRAGCTCGNKDLKQNHAPPIVNVRGIERRFDVRDLDLVAEGVRDYRDELDDIEEASFAIEQGEWL